ncbi:MAG TPA: condensation domain-containing protein, partial [Candidatus Limnocylindrales bacterium]|nr:condensation domain-containing protein [Candidatus Limnocylindrales bacterium]
MNLRISTEKLRLVQALHDSRNVTAPSPAKRISRNNVTGAIPASRQQRGLWLVDQLLAPEQRSAYHVPVVLRLHGQLDTHALQQTLTEIARRHET